MPKKMDGKNRAVRATLNIPFGHKRVKSKPPELGITVSQDKKIPGLGKKPTGNKPKARIWTTAKYAIGKEYKPVFTGGVNLSGKVTNKRKLPKEVRKSSTYKKQR